MPHSGATFKATGIAVNYFQRLQSSLARGVPTSISLLLSLSFSPRARFLERSKQHRKQDSIIFRLIRSRFMCVSQRNRQREKETGVQTITLPTACCPFPHDLIDIISNRRQYRLTNCARIKPESRRFNGHALICHREWHCVTI
jgi:hypothetical protein